MDELHCHLNGFNLIKMMGRSDKGFDKPDQTDKKIRKYQYEEIIDSDDSESEEVKYALRKHERLENRQFDQKQNRLEKIEANQSQISQRVDKLTNEFQEMETVIKDIKEIVLGMKTEWQNSKRMQSHHQNLNCQESFKTA